MWQRGKFATVALACQTAFIVLFGVFGHYVEFRGGDVVVVGMRYPMFQDVHLMIFIGFGFLMAFMRRYGFGAVGITFVIVSIAIQWHIIVKGLLELRINQWIIPIDFFTLITADYGAAAVLISCGAVLGKTSPLQLVIMTIIEICVYSVNEYIAVRYFKAADVGGSMIIHVFGAYFGLSASAVLYREDHVGSKNERSSYYSNLFSLIGTIFLWIFWPSFNAATISDQPGHMRAVVNTYLSLAASTVVAFCLSNLTDKKGKFSMVHVQNATLAGGVAIGTSANFLIGPWGAVLIGMTAACLSVVGNKYLQPYLARKHVHDSCGVNSLHGMPGILASVAGIIGASVASEEKYKTSISGLINVFTGMFNTNDLYSYVTGTPQISLARTSAEQAGYQAATLATTLGMAVVGGVIAGTIMRFTPGLDQPAKEVLFDDSEFWSLPDVSEAESDGPAVELSGRP